MFACDTPVFSAESTVPYAVTRAKRTAGSAGICASARVSQSLPEKQAQQLRFP